MTGSQFEALRKALDMPLVDFALALGYQGYANNLKRIIRRYQGRGEDLIPPSAETRARKLALDRGVRLP